MVYCLCVIFSADGFPQVIAAYDNETSANEHGERLLSTNPNVHGFEVQQFVLLRDYNNA